MTTEEIIKGLFQILVELIEANKQAKELAEAEGRINFGVKCNDDLQEQVDKQAKELDQLRLDNDQQNKDLREALERLVRRLPESEWTGCIAYEEAKALLAEHKESKK